jgi:DnaJ-class molecular chaperone
MPRELTAENGAKGLLSGEFKENAMTTCNACKGTGRNLSGASRCNRCKGTCEELLSLNVSWTTIKAIYAMAVKVLEVK